MPDALILAFTMPPVGFVVALRASRSASAEGRVDRNARAGMIIGAGLTVVYGAAIVVGILVFTRMSA
ncbi:hypothetical protein MN032_17420 [Agromyces atrinae]|uniref:hypothetical protein n=1 Tax=Agromyces atrinae TaxID=592376 RepID=UPI001F591921|nr:hypothetical protein [Agromyces atrinae]MCI2959467.1 hypothetical protein [Agromyces atrinae]